MSDHPGSDRRIEIVPSVLPADFSRLGAEVAALEEAGVDRIQWDVMDGRFVPNLTFGPDVIAACRAHASVPFEAHLMVEEPDDLASMYVDAGCELLIVHAEATRHLHRTLGHIRSLGAAAGVALNPSSPPGMIQHVLDLCDLVLVMTVNPGFGGQDYISTMEPKIAAVRRLIVEGGHDIDVEVDGGIGPATIQAAAAAGANVLVAGSALYRDPEGLSHAVTELRSLAEATPDLNRPTWSDHMGFLDKATGMLKGKGQEVSSVIDKVADLADDKTGGQHTEKIGDAAAKAKDAVKKLDS